MKTIVTAAVATLLYLGAYGQTFEQKTLDTPGADSYTRYHWADFNGDGTADIIEIDPYSIAVLHLSNAGSYSSVNVATENVRFMEGHYAFRDYDGDGDIDMLATQEYSLVIVNYNDNNNSFSVVNTGISYTDANDGSIYWADLDGDLVPDIIQGRRIFLNHQGTYTESQFILPEMLTNMVLDDFNGDGLADMIAGGYESYNGTEIRIYLNEGSGHFEKTGIVLPTPNLISKTITLIDADRDADIDIFVQDQYDRGFIFKNSFTQTGYVTFTATQIFSNIRPFKALAGDFNADGLQDLVMAGRTSLTLLRNTSNATALSFTQESYEMQFDLFLSLDIVDIDADKDPDVQLKGYSYTTTSAVNIIFEKIGITAEAAPSAPVNLSSAVQKNVSLSWNAVAGLLYNIEVKRNGVIYKPSEISTAGTSLMLSGNTLLRDGTLTLLELPVGSYEWRVQALSPSGLSSAFSAANTFNVTEGPSALTLQPSELRKVKLCWSYSGAGNPSFSIFRGTSSEAAVEIAQVNAGITCYEDNTVPENQSVQYYVIAVQSGAYSAPSNIVVHHSTLFVQSAFGITDPNIIEAKCLPADFDLDGDYDLEFIGRIGSFDNNVLLKNNGSGSYTAAGSMLSASALKLPYTEMTQPRDLDNDGDPDIVFVTGEESSWKKVTVFINNSGTFVTAFETPAYSDISQLAVEDMNNDGRPDLLFSNIVGNSSANPHQYQLLYQTSNGSFEDSKITFGNTETSTLSYFKCADLNNDSFTDILWTSADKKFTDIWINEGGSGFTQRTSILPVTGLAGVADYTGDGNIDVMVLGNEGLNLYFGEGDFTFKEPKVIPIGYLISSPSFVHADIDLNGLTDILITEGYNSQVLLNKGNGSFKSSDITLERNWGTSIAVTDFENDGDIDIVKLGNDGQHQGLNYLYRNQSADINIINLPPAAPGALSAIYTSGKAVFTWSPSTDDLTPVKLLTYNLRVVDAKGKIWLSSETTESGNFRRRLAAGNAGQNTIKQLNNLPVGVYKAYVQALDASFALSPWSKEAQFTIYQGPSNLTVERILLNKIKLAWSDSPFAETNVVVERRIIGSNWQLVAKLAAGTTSYTDDGLEYNTLYEYRVLESSDTETTAVSNTVEWNTNMWILEDTDIANLYGSMDIADFTGDGRMDMILNGGMIYNGYTEDITRATFENTPGGWVKRDITPSDLTHTAQIAFADLNADAKPDIYQHGYIWSSGYKTETFLNNGNKTFNTATNVFTTGTYAIQSYFDYDMDNDLDIIATQAGSYPTIKQVFQNNGSSGYSSVDALSCQQCPLTTSVADFDKDGDEDVIQLDGSTYQLYLNTPAGLVATGTTFPAYENKLDVTDYNNDGWPDVILLSSSFYHNGKIFRNAGLQNGSFQFIELPLNLSSGDASSLSADFDHDGRTDIAVLSPNISVLLNKGNDTFQHYQVPAMRLSLHIAGIIDFDNDGDLDIYISGYHVEDYSYYGRQAKILLNQTIVSSKGITNARPGAPQNLSSIQDSLGVHLSWNKPTDDHTSPEGITYDVVLFRNGKSITKGSHDPATGQRFRLNAGKSTGIATVNNLLVGSYTWRVQAIDGSFEASDFSAEGTFTFLPLPPTMNDTLIYRCGRTVTLTASGTDIKWYKDKELTQLIASGSFYPQETQTVYVVQTVDGYRGIPKRVRITIIEKPPVPSLYNANPYTICENSPSIHTLWAIGQNVRWYKDEALKDLLSSASEAQIPAEAASYFVTQTVEGCQSNALAIKVEQTTIDSRLYYKAGKIWARETQGTSYIWFRNGYYYQYTTEPYIPFDGEEASYVVSITKGQCQEDSQPFMVSETITAVENTDENILEMFPNPASSRVTLRSLKLNTTINIFDGMGKLVHSTDFDNKNEQTVDTSKWTRGVYVILIEDGNNVSTKRLVLL
jgi:hypothetical protein